MSTRRRKSKKRAAQTNDKDKHIRNNGAFFNKNNRYKSGAFKSLKMQRFVQYRSAYEYIYYKQLESDPKVLKYITEPVKIPYVDADGIVKNYIPDCLVLYDDGRMELCEIKPSEMLKAVNVKLKARAALKYTKEKGLNIIYKFITEKDLFKTPKDYKSALGKLK